MNDYTNDEKLMEKIELLGRVISGYVYTNNLTVMQDTVLEDRRKELNELLYEVSGLVLADDITFFKTRQDIHIEVVNELIQLDDPRIREIIMKPRELKKVSEDV